MKISLSVVYYSMKKSKQIQDEQSPVSSLPPDALRHWSDMIVSMIERCQLTHSPPFEESPFIGFVEAKLSFDLEETPVIMWIKRGRK